MALMITTLTLDKTGRLVLPKPVRDELQLRPGDSLELESSEERIVLRPARGNARMRKKHTLGMWETSSVLGSKWQGACRHHSNGLQAIQKIRRECFIAPLFSAAVNS